ncbi:GntR family transcriptional regulator [Muricoccus aerilatus]|uniref:GntR family transcriptional regulator n=1 Tax=Muricoccus aerilatus TaxID=452982 RepID=UPI00069453DF|nr:GntR family transcriptional regulator [Roseomonas aerilata]
MLELALERREPITRELYAALRQQILQGAMPPGMAISEAPVAEQLNVSRTPVREVFRRLADEGLLEIRPQIGTFVAPIRLSAVRDGQFVRETLECRTVRMAAETRNPDDRCRLAETIETQRRAVVARDEVAFFRSDESLHCELTRMAGRPAVWSVIQDVKLQLDRVRYLSFSGQDWLEMLLAEHEHLVECVLAGDADGAEAVMREHLRTVFTAIDRLLHSKPDFFTPRR